MALQWFSAQLATGRDIADLPGLDLGDNGTLTRTISNADTATLTLHLDENTPENWPTAVREGYSVLACYDDTDVTMSIAWAGYVTSITLDAANNEVAISAATFEAVLDRAYVGDTTYLTTQSRNDIIADLMTSWFMPGTGITVSLDYTPGGGPFPAPMDAPPIANAAIVMQNTDNASVKQRIDQLCGQLGGEYTVVWDWISDGQAIEPRLVFGTTIGNVPTGAAPTVTFDLPGALVAFTQTRDYSNGAGANKVVASSSGQGTTAPITVPLTAPRDGRPILEYRYQPAPSVSPQALAQYAAQAIAVLAPGARPITMTALLERSQGRRLGVDWTLGDEIGYSIPASYIDEEGTTIIMRPFPYGLTGTGRVIAYQLTETTITPVLADATVYVQS